MKITVCTFVCNACNANQVFWAYIYNTKWNTYRIKESQSFSKTFPGGSDGKVSVYNAGDWGSSPGLGRSPGKGNGNPLQHCSLENPMERGAW